MILHVTCADGAVRAVTLLRGANVPAVALVVEMELTRLGVRTHVYAKLSPEVYYLSELPPIKCYVYIRTMGFCPAEERECQLKYFEVVHK
jgi:hypothetical protein